MMFQLFLVILISTPQSIEIQFQCPVQQQWNIRAITHCQSKLEYVCLWNSFHLAYNEACIGPIEESGGYRIVQNINGNQDVEKCPLEYYQPENINFRTTQGDNCLYGKSLCSDVGQIIHSNGSTTADRSCRCDYTRGYAFISTRRKNPCYCMTSEEDCTCYSKECDENKILSPDYQCIRRDEYHKQYNCSELHAIYKDLTTEVSPSDSSTKHMSEIWNHSVAGIVTALFIMMVIICWKFKHIYRCCGKRELNEPQRIVIEKQEEEHELTIKDATVADSGKYTVCHGKAERCLDLKIKEFINIHLENIAIIEGIDAMFKCEIKEDVEENIASVQWLKNGSKLEGSDNIKLISEGRVYKLIIVAAKLDHSGRYEIVINQKYKSGADLDVKPFIKKQLKSKIIMEGLDVTLECEIEKSEKEHDISVKWLKDEIEINDKYVQAESDGGIYKLKIDPAELRHRGKYKIMFINKYESEADLDVNRNFFIFFYSYIYC